MRRSLVINHFYANKNTHKIKTSQLNNREPSHRGVCVQNLPTRGLEEGDDLTLAPIFCAGHVGIYQKKTCDYQKCQPD